MDYQRYEEMIPPAHRIPREGEIWTIFDVTYSGEGPEKTASIAYLNQLIGNEVYISTTSKNSNAELRVYYRVRTGGQEEERLIATVAAGNEGLNGKTFDLPEETASGQNFSRFSRIVVSGVEDSALPFTYFYIVESYTPERSRFAEFVLLCCVQGIEIGNMLEQTLLDFDLTSAVGRQLDFIGAIVGAERQLPFAIEGSDGLLNDDDFRLLIQARIASNMWDGTNQGLTNILRAVFSNYGFSFTDGGVDPETGLMTMKYQIRGKLSDIQKQMVRGDLIAPRPAGVDVVYEIIDTVANTNITTDTRLGSDFMQVGLQGAAEQEE